MSSRRTKAYLYLLGSTILWGAAVPVIKFTLAGISAIPFLTYRFTIMAVVATIILLITGVQFPKTTRTKIYLFLYGLTSTTIALGILFLSLEKTTVLDLVLIGSISPIVISIIGTMLFHEHITKKERLGISITLVGTFIAIVSPLLSSDSVRLSGNLLVVLFLIADGSSVIFAKELARARYSQFQATMIGFIIGFITLIPITIFMLPPSELINTVVSLPAKFHLGVWYMALLSGLVAYFLRNRGQQSIEVGEAQLFNYLQPVIAVPLAVLWLGESFTFLFVIGAIIIGSGVFIAEHKKAR
jgi:drug/metabolite transporter (DMT)-like permease